MSQEENQTEAPDSTPVVDPVQAVNDLRDRMYAGEELEPEEVEKVLTMCRAGRRAGAETASSKKKRAGGVAPGTRIDTGALLAGLTNLSNSTVKGE